MTTEKECSHCQGYEGMDFFSRMCPYHNLWGIPYEHWQREKRATPFSVSPFRYWLDFSDKNVKCVSIPASYFICGAD